LAVAGIKNFLSEPSKPSKPSEQSEAALPAHGTLTQDDLVAYSHRVLKSTPAALDTRELTGRSFKLSLTPTLGYNDTDKYVFAVYSLGAFMPQSVVSEIGTAVGFSLERNQSPDGSYVGENIFGATRKVDKYKVSEVALVHYKKYDPSEDTNDTGLPHNGVDWMAYRVNIPVENVVAANKIIGTTVLVVEGNISSLPSNQTSACGSEGTSNPTWSSPAEYDATTCIINADVHRVAFVNKSTGAVIAKWEK
jgi:hypothetical protein